MTETVMQDFSEAAVLFEAMTPAAAETINILDGGRDALKAANQSMGLALTAAEMDYLLEHFL